MKPFDPLDTSMTALSTDSDTKNGRVKKAGFLIHGVDHDGHRAMVAAYNEGRLAHKYKAYQLAAGTVEANEADNIIEAARREMLEETGVDVRDILGGYWHDLLKNGGALDFGEEGYTVPEGTYKGLNIRRVSATPHDFSYTSHANVPKRTHIFEIEVGNIDWFRQSNVLKNPVNAAEKCRDGKVRKTTWDQINNSNYPKFKEMLDWLRTGEMPANKSWNIGKKNPGKLYGSEDIVEVSPWRYENAGQTFARLEQEFFKGGAVKWNHRNWKEFCNGMDSKDYKRLSKAFTAIKDALDEIGVTKGDCDTIKLDDKDFPLTFYQEGADVIRVQDYFHYVEVLRANSDHYERAFAGMRFPAEVPLDQHMTPEQVDAALKEAATLSNADIERLALLDKLQGEHEHATREREPSQYGFIKSRFPKEHENAVKEGLSPIALRDDSWQRDMALARMNAGIWQLG